MWCICRCTEISWKCNRRCLYHCTANKAHMAHPFLGVSWRIHASCPFYVPSNTSSLHHCKNWHHNSTSLSSREWRDFCARDQSCNIGCSQQQSCKTRNKTDANIGTGTFVDCRCLYLLTGWMPVLFLLIDLVSKI